MGCFLACFGFSKTRKCRRKSTRKSLSGEQRHGSYIPLDSIVTPKHEKQENPINIRENKAKEHSSSLKIRKKVSFNLNVEVYEPIQIDASTDYWLESDEKKEDEADKEEEESLLLCERDSYVGGDYPTNHRYQNWRDGCDEEDIESVLSDIDDLDYDEDGDDDSINNENISDKQFWEQIDYSSRTDCDRVLLDEEEISSSMPLFSTVDVKPVGCGSKENAREKNSYVNVHSVLKPVENLMQWKAAKARVMSTVKHQRKDNALFKQEGKQVFGLETSLNSSVLQCRPNLSQSRPLMQEIAVDASLSNWLV
ncbi:hypothetical protein RJ641_003813 [Dillenia turbinata]|uniref:Uncharacterized protein n=1 Tax=Dillenia turbinata TaxID=194707 RepID=A0AAN8VDN2_9MAGN